jgi:hypothetical protein
MSPRRGYPLGALFVVVTACAVLIAGVSPLARMAVREEADLGRGLIAAAIGAGWGLFIGLLVGLIGHRTALASGLGALAGLFIGAAGGVICLLPARELTPAAAAMTAGSALIVGVALLMRRTDS